MAALWGHFSTDALQGKFSYILASRSYERFQPSDLMFIREALSHEDEWR